MVSQGEKTIDGLNGNALLKAYVFSMEGKMAAGGFGRTKNYGWDGPFREPSTLPAKSRGISSVSVVTITYLFIAGIGETRGSALCLNGQDQNK